ncbi:MAG: 1-acyl-sn-glycerol-3-phosphate acyltransferase [Actinobacteria bacterium]|nr:1-acyl-sn-glycerol-3-phosphate acyltransferase [Actinomycetota bacterium]
MTNLKNAALTIRTFVVVPLFVVWVIILSTGVIVTSWFKKDSELSERIIRLFARSFLLMAPTRLTIDDRSGLPDAAGQFVFVSNHLSNFDIPVVFLTTKHKIRFLAKKEVYKIPVFAQALDALGMIKIDRQGGASIRETINSGVKRARSRGLSLIVFPEGTRSVTGDLQVFKSGAFRIGIDTGMPIVPISIHGTWDMWPPGERVFRPGKVNVIVHPPIKTAGLKGSDVNRIRKQAHATIAAGLDELRGRES